MNAKPIKHTEVELDRPAPISITSIEEDREVINSVCAMASGRRVETSWSEVIQGGYSTTSSARRKQSENFFDYEDVFNYVLGILEDTDDLSFVESLYEFWSERGFLSDKQHTALMRFYNNLKRRYG